MVNRNRQVVDVVKVFENVERNSDIQIAVDPQIEDDCTGFYVPEARVVVVNPNQSDISVIQTIVHEVAHHVDITEQGNERSTLNGEIIARAVENIIVANVNQKVVIKAAEKWVRRNYDADGVNRVNIDEVNEIVVRVREIVGI